MPIHIDQRKEEGVPILALHGSFETAEDAKAFRTAIGRALAEGQFTILVNLCQVDKLENFGLETLLASIFMARHAGGALQLFGANCEAAAQLKAAGVASQMSSADSEGEVLENLQRPRAGRDGDSGESKPFDILEFVREEERRGEHPGAFSEAVPEPTAG